MEKKEITLNEKLKVKVTEIEHLKSLLATEVYAKRLLKLKKRYFKKIAAKDSCELDLSSFENLNKLIDEAHDVLINKD